MQPFKNYLVKGDVMWKKSFSMALGLLLLCSASVWAQSTGSISGVVTDESGAVIPGAAVSATNTQTGVIVKTNSLEDGKFLFGSLLPSGTHVDERLDPRIDTLSRGERTHVARVECRDAAVGQTAREQLDDALDDGRTPRSGKQERRRDQAVKVIGVGSPVPGCAEVERHLVHAARSADARTG